MPARAAMLPSVHGAARSEWTACSSGDSLRSASAPSQPSPWPDRQWMRSNTSTSFCTASREPSAGAAFSRAIISCAARSSRARSRSSSSRRCSTGGSRSIKGAPAAASNTKRPETMPVPSPSPPKRITPSQRPANTVSHGGVSRPASSIRRKRWPPLTMNRSPAASGSG
ncbi:hypothetical protein O166_16015 [Pseudogulbenkiania ferrooxidans EGD-HP2]|uniref:Uncharacterized protein n=1 Tax=Pseudogulbenkiania ferrooxidans EGD-HP2 TaxID=1388764 RepID=A0ABN0N243_9NEIS|nr:hypothetical protein O166_16015 [Pseudogulbenkiania ferrooxidans EGD-HP2]